MGEGVVGSKRVGGTKTGGVGRCVLFFSNLEGNGVPMVCYSPSSQLTLAFTVRGSKLYALGWHTVWLAHVRGLACVCRNPVLTRTALLTVSNYLPYINSLPTFQCRELALRPTKKAIGVWGSSSSSSGWAGCVYGAWHGMA